MFRRLQCSDPTIQVSTIQDEVQEEDERFTVWLSNPSNAWLANRYNTWTLITIEDDDENRPPRVRLSRICNSASPCPNKNRIESGGRTNFSAAASDQDGTVESYKWNGLGGFSNTSEDDVRWTAPQPHVETTYTLTVTVTDNEGATASDSFNITVEGPDREPANAPTVTLTADSYEVDGGGRLTLTANASDTDGRIVSYGWSGEGTFSGSGAEVTWRAPGPPVATDYVLSVTVTDNEGATASDSVSIRVGANSAPTLSVEADVYTVHPDEVVTLTGNASDTDGRIVSYRWSGGYAGFADVETEDTTWTAPDAVQPTNYVLSLTVTDDDGATASDSVSIRVARNRRPSVRLTAADYSIDVGDTVTLTADARDSDGTVVSYVWSDRASRGEFSDPATGATVDWGAALLRRRPNQSLRQRGRRQLDPSRRGEGAAEGTGGRWYLCRQRRLGVFRWYSRAWWRVSVRINAPAARGGLRTVATAAKCHRAPVDYHPVAGQMPTGLQ